MALVLLGLLAGIAGAAVTASVATARRTSTAYERLNDTTRVGDAIVNTFIGRDIADGVTDLDVVESAWSASFFVAEHRDDSLNYLAVVAGPPRPPDLLQPVVVEGRAPREDAVDEVVVFEPFLRLPGVDIEVGDVLPLTLLTSDDVARFDTGIGQPHGPEVRVRLVGVVRSGGRPEALPPLLGTPAFAARYGGDSVGAAAFVHLRGGDASADELQAGLDELSAGVVPPEGAEELAPFSVVYTAGAVDAVASTVRVLVTGLAAVAITIGLVGLVVVAQAFARMHAADADDQAIEAALGLTPIERTLARALPTLVSALVAAVATAVGSSAASVIEPLGAIRQYEPRPGAAANVVVIAAGAAIVAVVVLLVSAASAARAGRRARHARSLRTSRVVERLAALGGRPAGVVGVRFALEPGSGQASVPVRSAIVGTVAGVLGVLAALTFDSSLERLVGEPIRYGWPGDFEVVDTRPEITDVLVDDRRLRAVAVVTSAPVRLGDRTVPSYSYSKRKGELTWTILDGRLPIGVDDVVLGARVADQLDVGTGGVIELRDRRGGDHEFEVVGVGLGPSHDGEQLGANVLLTPTGQLRVGQSDTFQGAMVQVAASADRDAVLAEYGRDLEVIPREVPVEVDNLSQLGALPELLAAFLGLVAAAALANGLVLAGRHRDRDLAVLRTIGFTPRAAAGSVLVMAATTALIGIVIGTVVGIAVGSFVWREVVEGIGVATDTRVPVASLVAAVPITLAISLLIAAHPARRAATRSPAEGLRVE